MNNKKKGSRNPPGQSDMPSKSALRGMLATLKDAGNAKSDAEDAKDKIDNAITALEEMSDNADEISTLLESLVDHIDGLEGWIETHEEGHEECDEVAAERDRLKAEVEADARALAEKDQIIKIMDTDLDFLRRNKAVLETALADMKAARDRLATERTRQPWGARITCWHLTSRSTASPTPFIEVFTNRFAGRFLIQELMESNRRVLVIDPQPYENIRIQIPWNVETEQWVAKLISGPAASPNPDIEWPDVEVEKIPSGGRLG